MIDDLSINSCTKLLITLSEVDGLSSVSMTRIRYGLFNVITGPLMDGCSSISTILILDMVHNAHQAMSSF